jgi:hypothetical protein
MTNCFICGEPTEGDAEFCSASCFYTGEADLELPLAGESIADALDRKTEDK